MNSEQSQSKSYRLLVVAPYYAPQHYGGVVQVYDSLFGRLPSFDVVFCCQRQQGEAEAIREFDETAPEKRGYRVRRIDRLNLHLPETNPLIKTALTLNYLQQTRRQFLRVFREEKPDVVVCGATYPNGWLMNRLGEDVIKVNYNHGEEFTMPLPQGPYNRMLRRNQYKVVREADLNLCVSAYCAQTMIEKCDAPPERVMRFPNFIDTQRFKPPDDRAAVRQKLGWQDKTVILTVARLVPRKGVDQVLRALKWLDQGERLPENWHYVIGGDGPQTETLKQLASELGLGEQVQFIGFVPNAELPEYYGAADLFVQPNRDIQGDTEGFGVVFLEANACGTPVIGGQAGGTADAIEHGKSGFRVNGEDLNELSASLALLTNDENLQREMGQQGLERARRDFSLDRCVEKFDRLLCQVIDHKRHGAPYPTEETAHPAQQAVVQNQ